MAPLYQTAKFEEANPIPPRSRAEKSPSATLMPSLPYPIEIIVNPVSLPILELHWKSYLRLKLHWIVMSFLAGLIFLVILYFILKQCGRTSLSAQETKPHQDPSSSVASKKNLELEGGWDDMSWDTETPIEEQKSLLTGPDLPGHGASAPRAKPFRKEKDEQIGALAEKKRLVVKKLEKGESDAVDI